MSIRRCLFAVAAPFALSLSACSGGDDTDGSSDNLNTGGTYFPGAGAMPSAGFGPTQTGGAFGAGGSSAVPGAGGTVPAAGAGPGGLPGAGGFVGAGGDPIAGTGGSVEPPPPPPPPPPTNLRDPGTGPWMAVPPEQVAERCKMDYSLLQAAGARVGQLAVVRYGELCYNSRAGVDRPTAMWSATKTLGALVTGIASYQTRDFPRTGPKTGQLLDTDLASHWLDRFSYNDNATLAHVMAMVGHNSSLDYDRKNFSYDTVGSVQINTLSTMVNTAIGQDRARLGSSTADFARRFLFDAIGMTNSSWGGTIYAYSWSSTLEDMARVGLLILHGGVWGGQRLVDEGWIYKMTHPSFEDASTSYGYLTWLNAREGGAGIGGSLISGGNSGDPCAPPAVWPPSAYPHGLSQAPNCTYTASAADCDQTYDVGIWSAQGLGGQFIVGHAGLDLVIVAKDFGNGNGPTGMWEAVRPAVVALDPMYAGNEAGFCAAYAAGDYAPDLARPIVPPPN